VRYPIILIFSTLLIINLSCTIKSETTVYGSDNKTIEPTFIHWGTKHNTLSGVTITWLSSGPEDSIKWGYSKSFENGKYPAIRREDYKKYLYDYTFPPLKPISQIYYAIKSGKEWHGKKLFTTSVDTLSKSFSFIAGSDCHGGDDDHDSDSRWKLMSELILKEDSDFYLFTGDVVDDEDDWDLWDTFYKNSKNLFERKIVFYSWGNHEYGPIALHNTSLPGNEKWYSFSQGNTLFISLLTEEDFDIQSQWLLELLKNTDKEWIIIYFHRPFFTRGSHKDEMNDYRSTWWKAFDDYGVDVVLSGHTHSYIRTKPLNLNVGDNHAVSDYGSKPEQGRMAFVLGGLGGRNSRASDDWFAAKAYSGLHFVKFCITENKLHFETFSHQGDVIDSLTIYSEHHDLPQQGICAHRGANNTHPENTIAAFKEAIRLGVHMIEFDVQLSKDRELIVIHDKTVDRTTNGKGKVADLSLSEIKKLDAGSWKNVTYKNEKVPTLKETLEIMPTNIWLNIHIKDNREIGLAVAELIIKTNRIHQSVVACKPATAQAIHNVDKRIKICNMERGTNSTEYVTETISMNFDFIQLKERADFILPALIKELKKNGIRINYYGTNSADKLRLLFEAGVNFPLVDQVNEMIAVANDYGISPIIPKFGENYDN